MPHLTRTLWFIPALCLLFTACTAASGEVPKMPLSEGQTYRQLHLSETPAEPMIASWIPYFIVEPLLSAPDETVCRETVTGYLRSLRDLGINTVFVHVCAFGESIYPSVYYPALPAANGRDGMQIFTDACRALGLSLHAWINPLRLQTDEYMKEQTGDATLAAWYRDDTLRANTLSEWDGRWYLNPAAESTGKLLTGVITELIGSYHPDGIHIDDYFYPTTETAWDAKDFAASGADDLAAWRRDQITALMRTMYAAVHAADEQTIFSVSPQGNFEENYETLFADVPLWASAGDCCDLIIPQIYYGYKNESHPFAETLTEWSTLPRAENVSVAAGLAVYKVGQEDPFAGRGAGEWRTDPGLPARQTADVLLTPALSGAALYHSDALISLNAEESAALLDVLRGR